MKRFYWTIGMALMGLYLGWNSQPYPRPGSSFGGLKAILFPVLGLGAVGFGFGTIFTRPRPGWRLTITWMVTLAILSAFFGLGLLLPVKSFAVAEVIGGTLGAVVGAVVGVLHGYSIQRKLGLPQSR